MEPKIPAHVGVKVLLAATAINRFVEFKVTVSVRFGLLPFGKGRNCPSTASSNSCSWAVMWRTLWEEASNKAKRDLSPLHII